MVDIDVRLFTVENLYVNALRKVARIFDCDTFVQESDVVGFGRESVLAEPTEISRQDVLLLYVVKEPV